MKCEKHIKVHAPHCPICADEEREALLRVARAAKDLWGTSYFDHEKYPASLNEFAEALKEAEGLL